MTNRIIDIVLSRINKMRTGYIFTSSDFTDIVRDPSVLSRTLSALAKSGKIRKLGKERFDKPKQTILGVMPPSIDWMVQEFLAAYISSGTTRSCVSRHSVSK